MMNVNEFDLFSKDMKFYNLKYFKPPLYAEIMLIFEKNDCLYFAHTDDNSIIRIYYINFEEREENEF